ncbi:hypothetical protein HPP92_029079 [Vanilla planifolia]|uniref:Uncharacterized protein n=1 Tax=Vanilla planifolia TaxID=51239 RepID=A0A835P6T4_VANPL|nr:hypothetical protein HPP92_029068 [Vanilla planifolia]KAG0445968.1 hypothetical protein HPP92_029079 [Vanilla planifolia]
MKQSMVGTGQSPDGGIARSPQILVLRLVGGVSSFDQLRTEVLRRPAPKNFVRDDSRGRRQPQFKQTIQVSTTGTIFIGINGRLFVTGFGAGLEVLAVWNTAEREA